MKAETFAKYINVKNGVIAACSAMLMLIVGAVNGGDFAFAGNALTIFLILFVCYIILSADRIADKIKEYYDSYQEVKKKDD
jgi:hypothetical protein